jgi:hypothetical protein
MFVFFEKGVLMASQSIAFVIKRFFILYSTRASVALVIVVLCIPICILIWKNNQKFRIFFAYQATLAVKAAQLIQWNLLCLAFCIVLAMAQPVVRRSLEHLIQYKTSTFCLKCHISRVFPPVSSTELVLSNSKLATVSSAAARASFSTFSGGLNHNKACSTTSKAVQATETQPIKLYQKQGKSSDLFSTRREFFGQLVTVEPCYALPVRRPSRVAIRSSLPSNEIDKFTKLLPRLDDLAKLGVPIDQTFPAVRALFMEVNITKASTPDEREELYFFACRYLFVKMGEIEAAKKQKQEIHDFEMREREQKLLLEKQVHDFEMREREQKLLLEKQIHDLDMLERQERFKMSNGIKQASSQQNLSPQNIALPCEYSNKEEQKHEE